jgi:hypothetical protein
MFSISFRLSQRIKKASNRRSTNIVGKTRVNKMSINISEYSISEIEFIARVFPARLGAWKAQIIGNRLVW